MIQITVFVAVTALIAFLTYMQCKGKGPRSGAVASEGEQNKELFLAGGGLKWYFIAGSITLTNLSTDQLSAQTAHKWRC